MSGNSASQYRVLDSKALLTGADGDSLENVLIDPLPDGALCWVIAEEAMYRLAKNSMTAPSGTDVIATSKGTGSPGRWKVYGNGGGGAGATVLVEVDATLQHITADAFHRVDPVVEVAAASRTFVTCMATLQSGDFEGTGSFQARFEFSEDNMIWTDFDTYSVDPGKNGSDNFLLWLGQGGQIVSYTFAGRLVAHAAGFIRASFFGGGTSIDINPVALQVAQVP